MTTNLQEITDVVAKLDPELDRSDESFKIATVLLVSGQIGADIDAIAAFTNFDRDWLARIDANLRASGVWDDTQVRANWFDPQNGGIEFWLDVAVAQGLIERDTP